MPSTLYVSFFEEDDGISVSIRDALDAKRNRDPVIRRGITVPESFVADEKWFKFEVVKADEKEFALVWIKYPEYFEMPSDFSHAGKKVLSLSWNAFETEEKFEDFREPLFRELSRKHSEYHAREDFVKFKCAEKVTIGRVWTTWSSVSDFVSKIFVEDGPFKLLCDNVLVMQSLYPPSEPNFHAFEMCIWSLENNRRGIVQVEDDIDLTDRTSMSENDEAIFQCLNDDCARLVCESNPQVISVMHDRMLLLTSEVSASQYIKSECSDLISRIDAVSSALQRKFQDERKAVSNSIPFNSFLDHKYEDIRKAAQNQLNLECHEMLYASYKLIIKYILDAKAGDLESSSENHLRCNLATLLIDLLLPMNLSCHREYPDPFTKFSRASLKLVDLVVTKKDHDHSRIWQQEEKARFSKSNFDGHDVRLSQLLSRNADTIKLSRILKADANRFEAIHGSGKEFSCSGKTSMGSVLCGGKDSFYVFYECIFISDNFALLVKLTSRKVVTDVPEQSAYDTLVDYLTAIRMGSAELDGKSRLPEKNLESTMTGDPYVTPALVNRTIESSSSSSAKKNLFPSSKNGTKTVQNSLCRLSVLCKDSDGFPTHFLAKDLDSDMHVVLRQKRGYPEEAEKRLLAMVELSGISHALPLLSYYWTEPVSSNDMKMLITVHPLCHPLYDGREMKRVFGRSLSLADSLAILVAGLEFIEALQAHPKFYVHLDISPANVLISAAAASDPLKPEDVILCDFDSARSLVYSGTKIDAIPGTPGFTHPLLESMNEDYGDYELLCGNEDLYSLAQTIRYIIHDSVMGECLADVSSDLDSLLLAMENAGPWPLIAPFVKSAKTIYEKLIE